MPTIRPVGHKILIKPLEWEAKTDWGFQITSTEDSDSAKIEKAGRMVGTIAAVGPQAWVAHAVGLVDHAPLFKDEVLDDWAAIGDTVMYSRYAGKEIYDPETGEEYYLLNDEDVLAVMPPPSEWKFKPTEKGEKL